MKIANWKRTSEAVTARGFMIGTGGLEDTTGVGIKPMSSSKDNTSLMVLKWHTSRRKDEGKI